MTSEIRINPIGSIKIEGERFYLSVQDQYREALTGIEGFSHITVLWWGSHSDSSKQRSKSCVIKPYKKGPDTIGVFATRSNERPNPVLITTVTVTGVDCHKGIIEFPWIDAKAESPVIDIKPYQPCSDRVKNVTAPEWCSGWPNWLEDSATFDWESVFNF